MEVFQVVAEYIREKQGQHRSVPSVSWVSTISIDQGSLGGNYNMEVRIREVTTNPHVPIDFEAGNSAKALDHKNLRPRLRADLFPASLVDKPLNESKPPHERLLGAANCDFLGHRAPTSQQTSGHSLFGSRSRHKVCHSQFKYWRT